ncbi:MAG: DEAD/DEAH box helicase, partial [Gammaproteobacteria bacterium]|nr:DEAD/DEAH box helicase [Gammaproteobacteria bacterium]
MDHGLTFAPGARLLIRDEEWLVKTTLPVRAGSGVAIKVVGLSELVRNHEAVFLSDLEEITELRPQDTRLVTDTSPQYRRSKLYLESLLRRTPPTDNKIYLGHQGAMNDAPYQVESAHKALSALRPRILIADGVGLGKTIEAGILLSELIKRGRGDRILVVATRSMLAQFQEELWARFAIPLVRLDSVGLQRVRAKIPTNKNPFYYYNRVIVSVDTLKNDAQYRHYLEQCHWDVIVIDECHNVANTGSARNRLATLLARTCDSMVLTSATPHNGRPESFANLMNMLEPTAIADRSDYTAEEIAGLFVRRFKKDIEDQVAGQFSERKDHLIKIEANPTEEAFFDRLAAATFHTLDRGTSHDALYRISLLKGFLSSPAACLQTLEGRLKRIERRLAQLHGEILDDDDLLDDADLLQPELLKSDSKKQRLLADLTEDQAVLENLRDLVVAVIDQTAFSKYDRLLQLLGQLGADASPDAPRVLIFSERIATLEFLQAQLMAEFSTHESIIPVFHAGLPDVEQQSLVESFGKEDSSIRILL